MQENRFRRKGLTLLLPVLFLSGCDTPLPPSLSSLDREQDTLSFVYTDGDEQEQSRTFTIPHYPHAIRFNDCEEKLEGNFSECASELEIRQEGNNTVLYGNAFFLEDTSNLAFGSTEEYQLHILTKKIRTSFNYENFLEGWEENGTVLQKGKNSSNFFDGVSIYYLPRRD